MIQTNSVDIQALEYSILFDISQASPVLTLTNGSTASAPANLQWIFEILSPSGTIIHQGNWAAPDIAGDWAAPFVQNSGFPKPFGVMELGDYKVTVYVKDLAGEIFSLSKTITICRPAGNTKDSKNIYGKAIHSITTKCQTAQILAEDVSNYVYGGVIGTAVTKSFKLRYPSADDGTEPAPFEMASGFSAALIAITTSGSGYETFQTSVYDYDFGDLVTVRVKYVGRSNFPVHCNLDLGVLGCEIKQLIEDIESGNCDDKDAAIEKMHLINPLFNLAVTGILYPQSCIDPWAIVEKIKTIGGFDCNCCSTGINATAAITGSGPLTFGINATGDVSGSFDVVGNNVTLNIQDFSYVFKMCDAYTGAAFSVTPSTAGRVKTFCLNVDLSVLAQDLLDVIEANTTLLTQLQQMVSEQTVDIDPKCIKPLLGATANACDYVFTMDFQAPNIMINSLVDNAGVVRQVNVLFDGTNAAALQTKLNSMGIGSFVVAYNAPTLTVTTLANTKSLKYFLYTLAGNVHPSKYEVSNCTGVYTYTHEEVFQALIDWVCQIGAHTVKAGCAFDIHRLVAIAGQIQPVAIRSEDSLCQVFAKIAEAFNQLVKLVQAIKEVNCENIQEVFAGEADTMEAPDAIYGRFNGECKQIGAETLFTYMLSLATTNQGIKNLFCKAVSSCSLPVCAPVTNAVVTYDATNDELTVVITNTGAVKYKVGYRVVGTTPVLGLVEVDATAGATTTKVFTAVATTAQYEAVITAICASGDSAAFTAQSAPCETPGTFTVRQDGSDFYVIWGSIPAAVTHVRLTIRYPNGSIFSQNYEVATTAQPLVIAIPSGTVGDVRFTLQSVCDTINAWYSLPTAEVVVTVEKLSSCPLVTDAHVTVITDTTVTIEATKPTASVVPGSYTLRLSYAGGVKTVQVAAPGGSLITFNVTDLTPNTMYSWEIISNCDQDNSAPVAGGSFATEPDLANNSSVTNSGNIATADTMSLMLDGVLYWASDVVLAPAGVANFAVEENVVSIVKLKVKDFAMFDGTLTSNAVVYPVSSIEDGDTLVFTDVAIVNGLAITFTNVAP